jgi:hypothetical protein
MTDMSWSDDGTGCVSSASAIPNVIFEPVTNLADPSGFTGYQRIGLRQFNMLSDIAIMN